MKSAVLLSTLLSCFGVFAGNLALNGGFGELDEQGTPIAWNFKWVNQHQSGIEKVDDKNSLKLTVKASGNVHGFIQSAKQITLKKNQAYKLSGDIKSSVPGSAYIQIKLYKDRKEVKRHSTGSSKADWNIVSCVFNSADADYALILLRFQQAERHVGSSVWFRDVQLFPDDGSVAVEQAKTDITAVPLFKTCSIYVDAEGLSAENQVRYRKKDGGEWISGFPLVYDDGKKQLRGSIVGLEENTAYELKVVSGKKEFDVGFKTWNPAPPISKTVYIDASGFDGHLTITESGSPEGWIKYTSKPGVVLTAGVGAHSVIKLDRSARYIILEGLTLRGGDVHGVDISGAENIRVVNCDISGWGRVGVQRIDKNGMYYMGDERRAVNYDAGVNIHQARNVLVERCYIHDPRSTANSWAFSHPAGPNAIAIRSKGGTVVRYNDFIGSDLHLWNDCVEGHGNGKIDGGFYRDASIYGNIFAFGNDDGIELDGGQMNIRVFQNRIEGFLCGISTAPCLLGPSYIFNNIISDLGDEHGVVNWAFKNIYSVCGTGRIFFFNNTVHVQGSGFSNYGSRDTIPEHIVKGTSRNNLIYCASGHVSAGMFNRKSDFDYNLYYADAKELLDRELFTRNGVEKNGIFHKDPMLADAASGDYRLKPSSPALGAGVAIPGFTVSGKVNIGAFADDAAPALPYRPVPLATSVNQLRFAPGAKSATVSVSSESRDSDMAFTIKKNDVFDWLSVEPASGVLKPGGNMTLTVKVDHSKLPRTGLNRGAFLVRLADGFSRPVTLYVQGATHEISPKIAGAHVYIDADAPVNKAGLKAVSDANASNGKSMLFISEKLRNLDEKVFAEYAFDVPEAGNYYIFMRMRGAHPLGDHDSIFMAVDEDKYYTVPLRATTEWGWAIASNRDQGKFKPFEFGKGRHRIRLSPREGVWIDQILIAQNMDVVRSYLKSKK